ncbi:unnamed protein product, partial [Prorocentrum cordatum]
STAPAAAGRTAVAAAAGPTEGLAAGQNRCAAPPLSAAGAARPDARPGQILPESSLAATPAHLDVTLGRGQLRGLLDASLHSMPRVESTPRRHADREPDSAARHAAQRIAANPMVNIGRGIGPRSVEPEHSGQLRPVVLSVQAPVWGDVT